MPKNNDSKILNGADNLDGKFKTSPLTIEISGERRSGKTVLRAKLAMLLASLGNQVVIDSGNPRMNQMYLDESHHLPNEPRTIIILDKE